MRFAGFSPTPRLIAKCRAVDRPAACPTATYGVGVRDAEGFLRPLRGQRGQRLRSLVAAVRAAFEEVVAILRADREQAELREARVGVEDQAIRGGGESFAVRPTRRGALQAAAPVLDGGMAHARHRRRTVRNSCAGRRRRFRHSESACLAAASRTLVTATSAPSVTRESTSTRLRFARHRTRAPDAFVARHQRRGVLPGDGLRKQARVDIAERGLEAVGQALHQDSEQRPGAAVLRAARAAGARAACRRCSCPADPARRTSHEVLANQNPQLLCAWLRARCCGR